MKEIITEKQMKDAFRVAYDFMNKHNSILHEADEYTRTVNEIYGVAKTYGVNPLMMRLVVACYEFICDKSFAMRSQEGKDDT